MQYQERPPSAQGVGPGAGEAGGDSGAGSSDDGKETHSAGADQLAGLTPFVSSFMFIVCILNLVLFFIAVFVYFCISLQSQECQDDLLARAVSCLLCLTHPQMSMSCSVTRLPSQSRLFSKKKKTEGRFQIA